MQIIISQRNLNYDSQRYLTTLFEKLEINESVVDLKIEVTKIKYHDFTILTESAVFF